MGTPTAAPAKVLARCDTDIGKRRQPAFRLQADNMPPAGTGAAGALRHYLMRKMLAVRRPISFTPSP